MKKCSKIKLKSQFSLVIGQNTHFVLNQQDMIFGQFVLAQSVSIVIQGRLLGQSHFGFGHNSRLVAKVIGYILWHEKERWWNSWVEGSLFYLVVLLSVVQPSLGYDFSFLVHVITSLLHCRNLVSFQTLKSSSSRQADIFCKQVPKMVFHYIGAVLESGLESDDIWLAKINNRSQNEFRQLVLELIRGALAVGITAVCIVWNWIMVVRISLLCDELVEVETLMVIKRSLFLKCSSGSQELRLGFLGRNAECR